MSNEREDNEDGHLPQEYWPGNLPFRGRMNDLPQESRPSATPCRPKTRRSEKCASSSPAAPQPPSRQKYLESLRKSKDHKIKLDVSRSGRSSVCRLRSWSGCFTTLRRRCCRGWKGRKRIPLFSVPSASGSRGPSRRCPEAPRAETADPRDPGEHRWLGMIGPLVVVVRYPEGHDPHGQV